LPDPAIFRKFTKIVKFDPAGGSKLAIGQDGPVHRHEICDEGG
jgi:hypothetical protein